jgi:hypothetical protein
MSNKEKLPIKIYPPMTSQDDGMKTSRPATPKELPKVTAPPPPPGPPKNEG